MSLVGRTYQEVCANFRWNIPKQFNIAEVIATGTSVRVAPPCWSKQPADGWRNDLRTRAGALAAIGERIEFARVKRGDRVAILLPQCPETLIAHLAAYRLGAIALPLFTLFGPEAIEYRLNDSGAKIVVSNAMGIEKLVGIAEGLPRRQF